MGRRLPCLLLRLVLCPGKYAQATEKAQYEDIKQLRAFWPVVVSATMKT